MNRSVLSRAAVLVLAAALLASPVLAAGGRTTEKQPSLLAAVWQLLARIAPSLQKGGHTIDTEGRQMIVPDGATADDETEGRQMIEPNG